MLSARAIYEDIRANDATYRLFLSVAAKGETQGGWENERIAELTADAELSAKIRRHGEDEYKHGRLFQALLRKRNLEACDVPPETDYTMLLEKQGIGISHARLGSDKPLDDLELIAYLVHSRVTEQRAHEEVEQQRVVFAGDPELGGAIGMIADDEVDHLAYSHEELLRFCERGYAEPIRSMLREYALVEIGTYRDVSLAVLSRMGVALGWSRAKRSLLSFGIHAVYAIERLWTWRRMVVLRPPERANPLAPRPARA